MINVEYFPGEKLGTQQERPPNVTFGDASDFQV